MALQSVTLTLKLSLEMTYFWDWWEKLHFCYLQDRRFYQMEAHVFQNFFLRWDLTFPVKRGIKLPISGRHWHGLIARFKKKKTGIYIVSSLSLTVTLHHFWKCMLNSIRNVKFIKMRKPTMFITAMCVLFLDKFSLEFLIIISLPHLHCLFLFSAREEESFL